MVLTDGFKCLETLVNKNISQNELNIPTTFKALTWDEDSCKRDDLQENGYDTIVATDCIYTTNIEPLIKTMFKYVKKDGQIYILNTAPDYRAGVKDFIENLYLIHDIKVSIELLSLRYDNSFDAKFVAISICMSS